MGFWDKAKDVVGGAVETVAAQVAPITDLVEVQLASTGSPLLADFSNAIENNPKFKEYINEQDLDVVKEKLGSLATQDNTQAFKSILNKIADGELTEADYNIGAITGTVEAEKAALSNPAQAATPAPTSKPETTAQAATPTSTTKPETTAQAATPAAASDPVNPTTTATVTPVSAKADFSTVGPSIPAMKAEFAKIPNSEGLIQILNDDPKFAEQLHGAIENDSSVHGTLNVMLNKESGQELLGKITEGLQSDTNRKFFGEALDTIGASNTDEYNMGRLLGFVEASEELKSDPTNGEARQNFVAAAQGVGLDEGDANAMMMAGVQDNLMGMLGNFFEDPSGTMSGWADTLEGADFPGSNILAGLLEKLGPILEKVFGFVGKGVDNIQTMATDFKNSVGDPKTIHDAAKVTEFDKAELTDQLETSLEELKEIDGEIGAKYAGNRLEAIDPAFKKEMELVEQDPDLNSKFNAMMVGETSDVARRMVEMHEQMQNGVSVNDAVYSAAKLG